MNMVYKPGGLAMLPPDNEYGVQPWKFGQCFHQTMNMCTNLKVWQCFHQTVNMVYNPGGLAMLPWDNEYGVQTWKFDNASTRQ